VDPTSRSSSNFAQKANTRKDELKTTDASDSKSAEPADSRPTDAKKARK